MSNIPPTLLIQSEDFRNAWARAVSKIMEKGVIIPADNKRSVKTKDACVIISLEGNAIQEILDHKLHPYVPQSKGLDLYIKQFNESSVEAIKSKGEQPYTYLSRTKRQVDVLARLELLKQTFNKRVQLITWQPFDDLGEVDVPCLQRIWFRNLGNNEVEVHLSWRSHDAYGAWMWNIIGIFDYLRREVFEPAGLTPVKFVEFNNSLHIYDYDWKKASAIYELPEVMK